MLMRIIRKTRFRGSSSVKPGGVALIEAALILSGFLVILLLGYLFIYPKLRSRILAIDLEQGMDLVAAIGPEPIVFDFDPNRGGRILLSPTLAERELFKLSNRVSYNTYLKVGVCSFLVQIDDISNLCPGGLNAPVDRTQWNLNPPEPPLFALAEGTGAYAMRNGTDILTSRGCDDLIALFKRDVGGCKTKFKQLVKIDCTQPDRRAWGVVIMPDLPGHYDLCGVMSTRLSQAAYGVGGEGGGAGFYY